MGSVGIRRCLPSRQGIQMESAQGLRLAPSGYPLRPGCASCPMIPHPLPSVSPSPSQGTPAGSRERPCPGVVLAMIPAPRPSLSDSPSPLLREPDLPTSPVHPPPVPGCPVRCSSSPWAFPTRPLSAPALPAAFPPHCRSRAWPCSVPASRPRIPTSPRRSSRSRPESPTRPQAAQHGAVDPIGCVPFHRDSCPWSPCQRYLSSPGRWLLATQ